MALGEDIRLRVAGQLIETGEWIDVLNPFDNSLIARVASADAELVDRAIASAKAALERDDFKQWQRAEALDRAAVLLADRAEEFAVTLAKEAGKPLKQARVEAERAAGTLKFSADEARRLAGEMVPMEGGPAGAGKIGFVLRVPVGVVGAISPFNFPLNLVAHKLGPAIAAGCPVVLKPASATPLSGIALVELLVEAGVPADWLHVVAGPGAQTGNPLVDSPDVAAISFTGSVPVGWAIRSRAPRKRVMLELGSNAPLIVCADGDWQTAADKMAIHGYSHAGQSCISTQRVLLDESIADQFIERAIAELGELKVGDPLDPDTDVGPLIDVGERDRVHGWIEAAKQGGAKILAGGGLNADGTLQPTIIEGGSNSDQVWSGEVFGPVTVIRRFSDLGEAIAMANDSDYGLQAGIFTSDLATTLRAARELEYGGVMVNEVPTFRTDQMPYGGIKDSGNTREGPHYSVREFTEERLISIQP